MGKRLSEEATLLIRENVEVVLKEKLNILDEELPKIVTKHLLILNKEKEKEKLHTVEKILKNYIPLQKQIKNVENILLKENSSSTQYQEIKLKLEELKNLYEFIHKAIQDEEDYLNKKINESLSYNAKYGNKKAVYLIYKYKGRLYVLDNYYKKESTARKIKDDFYSNEKNFSYDRTSLLKDMYRRLSILCTTISYLS